MTGASTAIVLAGHGSLRQDSGRAMMRLSEELRGTGVAACVEAGFLNFSRPTLADAVERCAHAGVRRVVVQPYFLIAGKYVQEDLPVAVRAVAAAYPHTAIDIAGPLGKHPLLVELVCQRISELGEPADGSRSGLLLMAHGTPVTGANGPVEWAARHARVSMGFAASEASYLECNRPHIGEAITGLFDKGVDRVVAVPYFLHGGRHVREDLPEIIRTAQAVYGADRLRVTSHLGYDARLARIVVERAQACEEKQHDWTA